MLPPRPSSIAGVEARGSLMSNAPGSTPGARRVSATTCRQLTLSSVPKDLETIINVLKDMGVTVRVALPLFVALCSPALLLFGRWQSYDPRVPDQLLDFIHTYTVNVLKDAQVFQAHREGAKIDMEDLRLAIQSRVNNSFTQPPPRELMLELAADRNNQPLHVVPKRYGVLLPPEQLCLLNPNYQLGKKGAAEGEAE